MAFLLVGSKKERVADPRVLSVSEGIPFFISTPKSNASERVIRGNVDVLISFFGKSLSTTDGEG